MEDLRPPRLRPLPTDAYRASVLAVARRLLGQLLVREVDGTRLVGRIVETEAYAGLLDAASHSFRGETPRCRTMFGPVGRAYVYFTYGSHHCINVVAGDRRLAGAVLLRAVEPLDGLAEVRRRRAAATRGRIARQLAAGSADGELCNGPGKLAAAFAVDRALDGHDLTRSGPLWIARGDPVRRVQWTPRVGLGRNPAAAWLWRCVDAAFDGTTRVPATWPRAPRPHPALSRIRDSSRRTL